MALVSGDDLFFDLESHAAMGPSPVVWPWRSLRLLPDPEKALFPPWERMELDLLM